MQTQEGRKKRKPRGRAFLKGNKAAVGHGPHKDLTKASRTAVDRAIKEMWESGELDKFLVRFKEEARKPGTASYAKTMDIVFAGDVLERIETLLERKERQERDFLCYRIWHNAFDAQQTVLLSHYRRIYMMAGRRAAKTNTDARLIAQTAITCRAEGGMRALYVGKTITTAVEQVWNDLQALLKDIGIAVVEHRRNEGFIKLADGGEVYIRGNVTTEEREKLRGFKWDIAIIDEAQSQAALKYLIEDIIEPALVDRNGRLVVSGTGPRVRGTYWEEVLWLGQQQALRINWNLSQNPTIPHHETALQEVREEKQLTETDSLYVREYLGKISYDDDALVLRLKEPNYFTDEQLKAWIEAQPVTDVKLVAGLDYGFVDADGFAIIAYSDSRPERWLVFEYKARRTGVAELAEAVRRGLTYIETNPLYVRVLDKRFFIHADVGGAGKKIGYDLATQYQLPVQDAYQVNKDMAIELLQDEVRRGIFRVRAGGPFEDECKRTVFARNDRDQLTREIDDETYHPDLMDAVTYAMRTVWWFTRKGETK